MARNPKCEVMERNPPWRAWLFSTNFRCCSLTFKRFSGLPSDLSSASNLVGGKVSSISGCGVLRYLWFFCVKRQWGGWESENQWNFSPTTRLPEKKAGSSHPAISALLVHFWELKTVFLKEKFKLYRPNCGRHFSSPFPLRQNWKKSGKTCAKPWWIFGGTLGVCWCEQMFASENCTI